MTCATEHEEAKALIQAVRLFEPRHPELRLLFAVPNGGDRHKATAGKLRAEGVKPGVPDYVLPVARGGFHGLAIELKRLRGSETSGEQEQWLEALRAEGWRAEVCKGWVQALATLADYLGVRLDVGGEQSLPGSCASPSKSSGRRSLPQTKRARPGSSGTSLIMPTRALKW